MHDPARWWHEPKWRAFFALGGSFFVIVWSTTMTFVLLPDIAADFDVTLGAVGWVVIIESLVISALLLPLGGLGDRVGRKRFLIAGLCLFGVGAAASGLAPSFATLIVARAAMSIGNAMVQAVGTASIVAAFPPAERGVAMGSQTTSVSIGAASGPVVGGLAVGSVSWGVLFMLLTVPTAAVIVACVRFLPDDDVEGRAGSPRRLSDPIGATLSIGSVISLIVTIGDPFGAGLVSPGGAAMTALTVLLVTGFVRWELRHPDPLLDMRLLGLRVVALASTIRLLGFTAATALQLLLPVFIVSVRSASPRAAGVAVAMIAVGMAVGAQMAGRLYDRIGPRVPAVSGLLLQAALMAAIASTGEDGSLVALGALSLAAGFAQSTWNVPNNSALMGAAPTSALGVMGAFTNVNRTLGNVVGQALASAIVVAVMRSDGFDLPLDEVADVAGAPASFVSGWSLAFIVATGCSLAAAALASRLPGRSRR